jgi:hypothetical protein
MVAGMAAAMKRRIYKGTTMTTLDQNTLTQVAGGVSSNDALTQSLTAIQSSLDSLAASKNNQNNTLLPMVMMMAMRRR